MNEQPAAAVPPLFAALNRRHPDVDLVLLEDQRGPLPDPVDDAALGRVVDAVAAAAVAVAAEDAFEPVRLGYGPAPGTVVARCRMSGHRADGGAELAALRTRLERDGWQVRRLEGDVARVVARRDGLRLRASHAADTGVLLVELSSSPLHVGDQRARALVGRS